MLVLAVCCLPFLAQAQTTEIAGKLVKKPWSKSGQSYCAQGSDYYVVETAGGAETILAWDEKPQQWQKYEGKQVRVKGELVTKTIKHNPMEQHPVSMDGSDETKCTVFKIQTVVLAAGKGSKPKPEKPHVKGGK